MSLPTGVALTAAFKFYRAGALADPSPLPTAVTGSTYPDATAGPTPALTHAATGIFTATVFSSGQATQIGNYDSYVYSGDATLDNQYAPYSWFDVGVNNVTAIGGTAQTGRDIGASVLLSPGTGAGQLDFTSGVVKANLVQVLATALTETVGGYLVAGFKKFFNVVTPTSTMNEITLVDTTTTLTNSPVITDPLLSTVPGSYVSGSAGYALGLVATINTNVASLIARLGAFTGSGVNTVLGFFRALLRSDLTAPSDVGGTFDPVADSTEAISDSIVAGSGNTATFSGAAKVEIDAIKAKTDLLGVAAVGFISPVADDGITTTLYVARDYNVADGWQLDYPTTSTVYNTDVFTWSVGPFGSPLISLVGSYVNANQVRAQPTAAQTILLAQRIGQVLPLEIKVVRAGRTIEVVRGSALVKGVVSP